MPTSGIATEERSVTIAVRSVGSEADAAAHHHAVHDRDHRFAVARDQNIQVIFGRPKALGQWIAGLRCIVERANIAAGGEGAPAGAVKHNCANRGIVGPCRA